MDFKGDAFDRVEGRSSSPCLLAPGGALKKPMSQRTTKPLPPHPDVVVEAEQRVWSGRFPLDVVKFHQRRFDGAMSGTRTWELWRRGQAAALLPYDPVADAV